MPGEILIAEALGRAAVAGARALEPEFTNTKITTEAISEATHLAAKDRTKVPESLGLPAVELTGDEADSSSQIAGLLYEKADLLNATRAIAKRAIELVPQTATDKSTARGSQTLRWYMGGSLAIGRLAEAKHIVPLDPDKLPLIAPLPPLEINPAAQLSLLKFARRVGDIDLFPLQEMETQTYYPISSLPESSSPFIRDRLDRFGRPGYFAIDKLEYTIKNPLVAAIPLGTEQLFIMDPRNLLARKLIHGLEQFGRNGTAKFANDFSHLHDASTALYGAESITRHLARSLAAERALHPGTLFLHAHNSAFNDRLGKVTNGLLSDDPNFSWLAQLKVDPSRSIEYLNVLGRLTSDADKEAVTAFINRHATGVEKWTHLNTEENTLAIAKHVFDSQPKLKMELEDAVGNPLTSVDDVAAVFKKKPYRQHAAAESMAYAGLTVRPQASHVMGTLMLLNPEQVTQELMAIEKLLPLLDWQLEAILQEPVISQTAARKILFDESRGIDPSKLSIQQIEDFRDQMDEALTHCRWDLPTSKFHRPSDAERIERMREILATYRRLSGSSV